MHLFRRRRNNPIIARPHQGVAPTAEQPPSDRLGGAPKSRPPISVSGEPELTPASTTVETPMSTCIRLHARVWDPFSRQNDWVIDCQRRTKRGVGRITFHLEHMSRDFEIAAIDANRGGDASFKGFATDQIHRGLQAHNSCPTRPVQRDPSVLKSTGANVESAQVA